mmetsp:Transcript_138473/g.442588  ORF Transcript_138473/g.442588 Transcript_138473/m.442588 type:complete len:259 (+) Transcript_138473:561-1337(+)
MLSCWSWSRTLRRCPSATNLAEGVPLRPWTRRCSACSGGTTAPSRRFCLSSAAAPSPTSASTRTRSRRRCSGATSSWPCRCTRTKEATRPTSRSFGKCWAGCSPSPRVAMAKRTICSRASRNNARRHSSSARTPPPTQGPTRRTSCRRACVCTIGGSDCTSRRCSSGNGSKRRSTRWGGPAPRAAGAPAQVAAPRRRQRCRRCAASSGPLRRRFSACRVAPGLRTQPSGCCAGSCARAWRPSLWPLSWIPWPRSRMYH